MLMAFCGGDLLWWSRRHSRWDAGGSSGRMSLSPDRGLWDILLVLGLWRGVAGLEGHGKTDGNRGGWLVRHKQAGLLSWSHRGEDIRGW